MAKWIKNSSGSDKTYSGQLISNNTYYEIQAYEEVTWANNSVLLVDIAAGDALVAKDDSGANDITDINTAVNYLKSLLPIEVEAKSKGIRDPNGFRARLVCIADQTITKNTTTNIDWLIPQLTYAAANKKSYFDGLQYYIKDGAPGDNCTFQVLDKDGSGVTLGLYPQAYYDAYKDVNNILIVEEFANSWSLAPDKLHDILLYKARLYPGLYIRSKIVSVGTVTDPYIVINMFRHLDENS